MSNAKTQVVSGSGNFNAAEVTEFASASQLASAGVQYQIVAITGPQSSGKSTLLNHVVGLLSNVTISLTLSLVCLIQLAAAYVASLIK